MGKNLIRDIFFYKRYFLDFYSEQNEDVKRKFDWTLELIATIERVPAKFFNHMEGTIGLYEIRVEVGNNILGLLLFSMKDI